MKKLIKFKILPLLIMTALMLTACGGGNKEEEKKISFDGFDASADTAFNSKALSDFKAGTAPERYNGGSYEPSDLLNADFGSYEIQIYEDVYKFPMTFSEFMSYGWRLDGAQQYDVKGERMARVWFKNGVLRLCFYIYNPDTVPHTYDACYVNGLTTFWDGTEADTNIFVPGGQRLKTGTKDAFLASVPQPAEITENSAGETFVTYSAGDNTGRFIIRFGQDGSLEGFEVQSYEIPDSFEQSEVDESFVTEYKAPDKLGTDPRDGVFMLGDELYKAPVPLSAMLDYRWQLTEKEGVESVTDSETYIPAEKEFKAYVAKRGVTRELTLTNPYDDPCKAKNCVLHFALSGTYDKEFVLSGNIKEGMTEADVLSVLDSNQIRYERNDETDSITFTGDKEHKTESVTFHIHFNDGKAYSVYITY